MAESSLNRQDIEKEIIKIIAKEGMIDESRIVPEATLKSLELDSMTVVMVLMAIEEKFNVYVPMDGTLSEVSDLRGLIDTLVGIIQKRNG